MKRFFVFKTQENLGHWSVFPMTIFLFVPFSPHLTQNHFIASILKQICKRYLILMCFYYLQDFRWSGVQNSLLNQGCLCISFSQLNYKQEIVLKPNIWRKKYKLLIIILNKSQTQGTCGRLLRKVILPSATPVWCNIKHIRYLNRIRRKIPAQHISLTQSFQ